MPDHTIERIKEIIETITTSYDKLKEFEKNSCPKEQLENELITIRDTAGEIPSLLIQIFKENPEQMLTDLISIVRYSIGKDDLLMPFEKIVDERFVKWLETQESSGRKFSAEQKEWLVMIKEHIASSVSISLEDMDYAPFNQKGGRMKLFKIFGDDYEKILSELHEVLISQ